MGARVRRFVRLAAVVCSVAIVATGATATAAEPGYAPVDRPGPPLSVPAGALHDAVRCTPGVRAGERDPVLLVHGTLLNVKLNFSWTYEPAFRAQGRPYCTVELPDNGLADIQDGAEYVVNAIRVMHQASGRKVDVVGFSQGGMIGRWALRFWPDTRPMVDDLVGLDPSNNGTLDSFAVCAPGCAPSIRQQRTGSNFMKALNSPRQTFAGIDYTQIYTPTDEVVVPNLDPVASSALHTGDGDISNVSTLNICPVHVADHLTMGTFDPVGYDLVTDALDHPGPAEPARIDRKVCTRLVHPGVDPLQVPGRMTAIGLAVADGLALYPKVFAEPALKPYVFD
jgi:pimeloyl-ACP methyl ester carboxylesterase